MANPHTSAIEGQKIGVVDHARRPRREPTLMVRTRVTAEQLEVLERMAEEDCSSVSGIIRRLISRQLAAVQRPEARDDSSAA